MKKYLSMMAASLLMMTACSNDEVVPENGTSEEASLPTLTIALSPGGDGLSTRAARPVYSSQAASNVDNVKLIVYPEGETNPLTLPDEGVITWTAATDLNANDGIPGTEDHGTQMTYKFAKGQIVAGKKYTIIAYGYNSTEFKYTITGGGASTDFLATNTGSEVEELFAVKKDITANNLGTFTNEKIEMRRQVAGVLGYFKNIPVQSPVGGSGDLRKVKFIKLIASQAQSAFTFPNTENNIVNGSGTMTDNKEIFSIDLSSIATNYEGTSEGTFTIPAQNTTECKTVVNSALAGKFMIPTALKTGTTTLTLALYSADGSTQLKSWKVNIPATVSGDESRTVYSIRKNVFYSIGKKYAAGSTDPTPETPGDDEDDPIDLSKEAEITLIVNDAWDIINNMGIED